MYVLARVLVLRTPNAACFQLFHRFLRNNDEKAENWGKIQQTSKMAIANKMQFNVFIGLFSFLTLSK